jgi:hypothetical protein
MTKFCEVFVYKVPSPTGGGLGWGQCKLKDLGMEEIV